MLINYEKLKELFGAGSYAQMRNSHKEWIEAYIRDGLKTRQDEWTESIAVGSRKFIENVKGLLAHRAKGRDVIEGSAAMREVQKLVGDMLKNTIPRSRPRRDDFLNISFEYKPGRPLPLYRYEEQRLETALVCSECGLRYAVYGVFAYCPDCGSHNSLQILDTNLELAEKELHLAATLDGPLTGQLITDALENAVSAFDAFGRELFLVNSDLSLSPETAGRISCQNLERLKSRVTNLFEIDLESPFTGDEWSLLVRAFQKRHLIAHRAGVVDQVYIDATSDAGAMLGRKVQLDSGEVELVLPLVRRLGEHLHNAFRIKRAEPD